MTKNSLKKKVITGVLLGSVITSLGMTAFASNLNQGQNGENSQNMNMKKDAGLKNMENKRGQQNMEKRMEERLKMTGIFTDSEIQKIMKYLESKKPEMNKVRENFKGKTNEEKKAFFEANKGKRQEMMNGLVSNKIITQAQLDKLKELMPQGKSFGQDKGQEKGHQRMEANLKKTGIFTDNQIQKIKAYVESKRPEMNKVRENFKGKTNEERKACFEANKNKRQEMMNGLVTNKIITQGQLDKLKDLMPQQGDFKNK